MWGWIKGWFDEYTREKIVILGKTTNAGVSETIRTSIDAKDLPKMYGGELEWVFEDGPKLDEAAKGVLGEMPRGPLLFEDGVVRRPKEYVPQRLEAEKKVEELAGIQTIVSQAQDMKVA